MGVRRCGNKARSSQEEHHVRSYRRNVYTVEYVVVKGPNDGKTLLSQQIRYILRVNSPKAINRARKDFSFVRKKL